MISKVFVHIGLPKTATTSLQVDFFPYLAEENFLYAGVVQPRTSRSHPLYNAFIRAVNTGENIEGVRALLCEQLTAGRSVVLSEEGIVVSDNASWEKKLDNLSLLLAGLDYKILVTVREPASALASCYVELIDRFTGMNKDFLDIACNHPDMKIYHYRYFFGVLWACLGRERVSVASFEDIIAGNLTTIYKFFEDPKMEPRFSGISFHNAKKERGDKVRSGKFRMSVGGMLWTLVQKNGLGKCLCSKDNKMLRPVVRFLDRLRFGEISVEKPSEQEKQMLREALSCETEILNSELSIDYR